MNRILTGLDRFRKGYWKRLKGYRIGLLANQASVDGNLTPAQEMFFEYLPGQVKALFGPQHGYAGVDQDNMVETLHSYDRKSGVPIFSLYSEVREPLPHMLKEIDTLVVDLQDVGTRVYTFPSTMLNCLKAAGREKKRVVVLDRPNPLGGEVVEGNLLRPELFSFVGPFSMPMRHGLTMGEMARMFNDYFDLGCELEIVTMEGWQRSMLWEDAGLTWVMVSPNMPLAQTARIYPGQVIWEGTNLSEGRGTCRPFEIFGAPFIDPKAVREALDPEAMAGCLLQEYVFRPAFHKWKGEICRGFMIHVLDPHLYQPYWSSLSLLKAVMDIHHTRVEWRPPPYEYEQEKLPIDLILGDTSLRRKLETRGDFSYLREWLSRDVSSFVSWRKPYLLYA